ERFEERALVGEQLAARVPEGADAWQHDGARVEHFLGLGHEAGLRALRFERLADAVQVPDAVVEDPDVQAHDPPLSFGSTSSRTTLRRAVAEGGPTVMRTYGVRSPPKSRTWTPCSASAAARRLGSTGGLVKRKFASLRNTVKPRSSSVRLRLRRSARTPSTTPLR